MFNFWIIVLYLGLLAAKPTTGQSDNLDVQLVVPRYVERGASATLQCRHNVRPEILFKVTWLKVDVGKFFEFINGRNPPFRNFTVDGGEVDWEKSNQTQVTIKNVDFGFAGQYYCEVSTDTPIFTKPSADELLSVFLPQTGPPTIKFRKRRPFAIGERLFALCNTTRARPAPHITWLINGKKVEDKYVTTHHVYSLSGKNHRRSQQQQQQQQHQLQQQLQQQQYHHSQDSNHYQQQYHMTHLQDRYDKSLRYSGRPGDDYIGHLGHHYNYASMYNNPLSSLTMYDPDDIREAHQRNYDSRRKHIEMKKRLEMKKHKSTTPRKYRRHINENALGIIRSTLNSGGFGPQPPNINNELGIPPNAGPMIQLAAGYGRPISHPGGGSGVAAAAAAVTAAQQEKGMYTMSQLNIELTEQHIGNNGRMEITCLSTIPQAVGPGEQFADYKTYSVKVEIENQLSATTTTTQQPNIGMAALGNGAAVTSAAAANAGTLKSPIVKAHIIWTTTTSMVSSSTSVILLMLLQLLRSQLRY